MRRSLEVGVRQLVAPPTTSLGGGGDSDPSDEVDSSVSHDSASLTRPRWLTWDGAETLTVDVFADGSVECSFHWRTSGLYRDEPCDGCDFDFDVVGVVDTGASSCAGSTSFRSHRWWTGGGLYKDGDRVVESTLEDATVIARQYTLDVDPTYGAPVAVTWDLRAELR